MTEPTDRQQQLLDDADPAAWALVAAVHAGSAERVAELLQGRTRDELAAIAVLLADQMPRPKRARLSGRGDVECGTDDGYREHKRRGETTCALCREAHARRNAGYRQAKKDRDRSGARAQTVRAIALGEPVRPLQQLGPSWVAYTADRAGERSPARWVLHAVTDVADLTGTAETECGQPVANRIGDWTHGEPRNCRRCARLVAEQTLAQQPA